MRRHGAYTTSIICAIPQDRPGALLSILQEFSLRAVNLSRLESRPARTGLGRYVFFIDADETLMLDRVVDTAALRGDAYYLTCEYGGMRYAMFAAAGTPADITRRLAEEVAKGLRHNDARDVFDKQGLQTASSRPEELAALVATEVSKWAKVIKAAGITVK